MALLLINESKAMRQIGKDKGSFPSNLSGSDTGILVIAICVHIVSSMRSVSGPELMVLFSASRILESRLSLGYGKLGLDSVRWGSLSGAALRPYSCCCKLGLSLCVRYVCVSNRRSGCKSHSKIINFGSCGTVLFILRTLWAPPRSGLRLGGSTAVKL